MSRQSHHVHCKAREYVHKLTHGLVSFADELQIEMLVKLRCQEAILLEQEYNRYCIQKAQKKKDQDDPASQEENVKGR